MKPLFLLVACIVGYTNAAAFFTSGTQAFFNTGNQIFINGHEISIETEPKPKLTVDGKDIDLSTAGSTDKGTDFVLYKDFTVLPGLSVKLYDNGGYTVYYEKDGFISRFGSLSKEERQQMNEQIQKTFDNVNKHMAQVQQNVGNIMQSLNNMFRGWPFIG